MEQALLGLLDDFHSGKLKAFGKWTFYAYWERHFEVIKFDEK